MQVEPTFGNSKGLYQNILQAIGTIIRKEGIASLWKGLIPGQVLTITYGAGQVS